MLTLERRATMRAMCKVRWQGCQRSGIPIAERVREKGLTRMNGGDIFCIARRRNWLFADTVKVAKAVAALYSLGSTARINGLDPYAYPLRFFAELPNAKTVEDFEMLLLFIGPFGKAGL